MVSTPRLRLAVVVSLIGAGVGLLGASVGGMVELAQGVPTAAAVECHHPHELPPDPARDL